MSRLGRSLCSMVVGAALLIGLMPVMSVAADEVFTVTSQLDLPDLSPGDGACLAEGGACTLRAAIEESNALDGVDTIIVPAGTYVLESGSLDLTDSVSISGAGSGATVVDGNASNRIFLIATTGDVVISGLAIQNGYAGRGGGISIESGQAALEDVIVQRNIAEDGGGIWNTGTLTITSSHVANNRTELGSGGGINNWGGTVTLINAAIDDNHALTAGGGIFADGGSIVMTGGSVSRNAVDNASGGGILGYSVSVSLAGVDVIDNFAGGAAHGGPLAIAGGVGVMYGSLTIIDSRIERNLVYGSGGGVFVERSAFSLDGGTIHQNMARFGGGIYGSGTISNVAITDNYVEATFDEGGTGGGIQGGGTLTNVTISGNLVEGNDEYPAQGTAIYGSATLVNVTIANNATSANTGPVSPIYATGAFEVGNTIVADASLLGCAGASVTSLGYNIDQGTTCGFATPGDQSGVDPLLGPLADNGGATLTHALLPGSPAIDAGDNGQCPAIDQRGQPRPFDGDGDGVAVCDVGAYESQEVIAPVDTTPPVIAPVSDLHVTATARSGAKVVYTAPTYEDAVSGSGTATCTPASGTRFKLGQTTVNCQATDDAGNTAEVSFNVYVTYSWSGFLSPIKANGKTTVKSGSMVPIKFRLTGASANVTDAVARLTIERVSDGYKPVQDARFSYNGQYMYQWKTTGMKPGEYRLTVNLGDGVSDRMTIITVR